MILYDAPADNQQRRAGGGQGQVVDPIITVKFVDQETNTGKEGYPTYHGPFDLRGLTRLEAACAGSIGAYGWDIVTGHSSGGGLEKGENEDDERCTSERT